MSFRLYKRIGIAPGLRLNINKGGPSLTVGRGALHYTVGRRGTRTTLGVPGTGLYYTKQHNWRTARAVPTRSAAGTPARSALSQALMLPFDLLLGALYLAAFLAGLAAIALVAVVAVGTIALLAGWPHGAGVALSVLVTLLGLLFVLASAAEHTPHR